jgi:hypothetical protein
VGSGDEAARLFWGGINCLLRKKRFLQTLRYMCVTGEVRDKVYVHRI